MEVPKILDNQECIIKWARKMKNEKYMPLSAIIKLLLSPDVHRHYEDDQELLKSRAVYDTYNNSHRSNILMAIMMDCYRKENDFKEGDIVTNGLSVGFAREIDFCTRRFTLVPSIERTNLTLGRFDMNDFSKVNSGK